MTETKEMEQPKVELQQVLDAVMEAEPEVVSFYGKKHRICWLHNGVTRKFSHIMLKEADAWKRNVKVTACVLLNRRNGLWTWVLLKAWYWVYWRWLYYVRDIDQVEVMGVLDAAKKKIQSEPLALATILATGMMDTMMTMARHEVGQAGRDGV